MIPLPLSKRDIFSPTTRLRHVPVKRRAGLALICLGTQILEEVFMVILKRKGKKTPLLCQYVFIFSSCFILFLLISAKDNSSKCWPCLRVAQGEWKRGAEQILHPAIQPTPSTTTRPLESKAFAYNWGCFFWCFFYVTKSSGYFVRLPLPCVVCAFAFYNSPKMRVFLLFKGVIEVKAMVRCQRSMWRLQTFMKLLCRDSGRNWDELQLLIACYLFLSSTDDMPAQ